MACGDGNRNGCDRAFSFLPALFLLLKNIRETGKNNLFRMPPTVQKAGPDIAANLFITGFISSSVQLLLLREMMNITGGYELIAGAFLCSWLIGSAAGSGLAPGSSLTDIRKINLLLFNWSSGFNYPDVIVFKALPETRRDTFFPWQVLFLRSWFFFRSV